MSEKSRLLKSSANTSSKKYGSVSHKYTLLDSIPKTHFTKLQCILVTSAIILAIVVFIVTLIIGLPKLRQKRNEYFLGAFPVSDEDVVSYSNAIVIVDSEPCAEIGKNVLLANGSAVDAAIAMAFCNEVANPQSMGIGGGFLMTIYNKETMSSEVIDARETAPLHANSSMFNDNKKLSEEGALSIAVPGQVRGLWMAHQKYGVLKWSDLIKPSIALCKNGVIVSEHLERELIKAESIILSEESLRELFVNNETGKVLKSGDLMFRPKLAETFDEIDDDDDGVEEFYNGSIATNLTNDINAMGGIITMDDLRNYQAKSRMAINVSFHNGEYRLLSVPPPGSGAIVAYLSNLFDSLNFTCKSEYTIEERILIYHKIIESFKFALAKREQLGDPDFSDLSQIVNDLTLEKYAQNTVLKIQETAQHPLYYGFINNVMMNDQGTGHISVISAKGDAVSLTSTINYAFGAKRVSRSTGIILNNEMSDFYVPLKSEVSSSTPVSLLRDSNIIAPGKRPLSSMSPSIIIDKSGNPKIVIGGIGGTRIVPSIAWVLYHSLWHCDTLKEATDSLRLTFESSTDHVLYEANFPKVFVDGLFRHGHKLAVDTQTASVYTILRNDSLYHAMIDNRKGGSADGY